MRKRIGALLCSFAFCALPQSTFGQISGNLLYDWCRSPEPALEALCFVDIDGALDGAILGTGSAFLKLFVFVAPSLTDEDRQSLAKLKSGEMQGYCRPEGVTGAQVRDILIGYLEEPHEKRHEMGALLLSLALTEAFPCPPSVLN
jgi:hypothetical protein